jgi:phosphoglycerate dehydrogenase-like enzyme
VPRGEVVNQGDLLAALQGGTIAGAYLDVFEVERYPPIHRSGIYPRC